MATNIECKAIARDHAELRQKAEALGARPAGVLHQVDTFFACTHGRLKLRQFAQGTAELIAYERSDRAELRASDYVRVPIPEDAALHRALERSLGIRAVVRKARELWLLGTTRIHLDRVKDLGDFVELEVVLDEGQERAEGERLAERLLRQLGIESQDIVAQAYVDLLEAREA